MSQKFPLTMKYQKPEQVQPAEVMTVVDDDQLGRITQIISGQREQETKTSFPLHHRVTELIALMTALSDSCHTAEQTNQGRAPAPPSPGTDMGEGVVACVKLSALRALGSSPKQMAYLLGANTGYFPEEGEDPIVYFSLSRFQPVPGFFDLAVDGAP